MTIQRQSGWPREAHGWKYSNIAKYFPTLHIHFQVMVVEANPVESFTPGVEIAVVRDMEGGLLLVCSASGK